MRKIFNILIILLPLAVTSITINVHAATLSDAAREQRWAEEVTETLFDGEAITLSVDQHDFLAIEMEAESDHGLAMIVIHGIGIHPNWQQVIHPVRVEMNNHGWHTLSIQMPILDKEKPSEDYLALFPESSNRLETAVRYLQDKGAKKIVIVAHSMGSAMAAHYLADLTDESIFAFVGIGMPSTDHYIQTIKIPFLDIYGSEDLPEVLENVESRSLAANIAKNLAFEQIEVPGANHFFDDKDEQLIEQIDEWLSSLSAFSDH